MSSTEMHDEHKQPIAFEGAQMIGHLVDIGFARSGDVLIKLRIPYRFKKSALPMTDAWNLPLDINIQTWQYYDQLREEISGQPAGDGEDR